MAGRLILVLNPRSSQYAAVTREILEPARKLKGWTVGKFELDLGDVDENAARLAGILQDGDLVVAAGGDGTASVAVNGVMMAEEGRSGVGVGARKRVTLAALGYSAAEAAQAVRKVEHADEMDVEELLKAALKHLF